MKHKFSIIFLLLWPIVAYFLSFLFSVNALFSAVIFYGVPSILLTVQKPRFVKRSFFASLFIIPFMIIVDYIAQVTKIWLWPLPNSVFSYKFFSFVSIEVILWAFLHMFAAVMFYQYFFEKSVVKKFWNRKSRMALWITAGISVTFLLMLYLNPALLRIPYWYFVFGMIFVLPGVIMEDLRFPTIFPKLLKTAMYFFYLNFTYEIAALKIGWWAFPSTQFVGRVYFFGVNFPFEEMFFWIILFTLAVLSYYEYFFNAEK